MTWLFSNLEGSVDTQTVANTGVTQRNYRDPYGAPITMTGGVWADGNAYMNKPATASTGLTTVGARTYDPVLGKFLSVDPVIDTNLPQQNTGYTYSGNNPTTYNDPSGLKFAIENAVASRKPGKKIGYSADAKRVNFPQIYEARSVSEMHADKVKSQYLKPGLLDPAPKKTTPKIQRDANPYPWGPLVTFDPNFKNEPDADGNRLGYRIFSASASISQWITMTSGVASIGVAAVALAAPPTAPITVPVAGVLGYLATASGIAATVSDCVAHAFDGMCQGQLITALPGTAISILGGPVGGVLAGGIFSVQTGAVWALAGELNTNRPKIDW